MNYNIILIIKTKKLLLIFLYYLNDNKILNNNDNKILNSKDV